MRHAGRWKEIGLCLLMGLLLAVPTTGGSVTLWVDANGLEDDVAYFRTITAALKRAAHQPGYTTIWVAPGEYRESVSIEVVGVKLQAPEGPEKTKIFGTVAVLTKSVSMEGFSVSPSASAPALLIKGHRAYVSQVIVQNSESVGIGIEDADDVLLDQVTVRENAVGIKVSSGRGAQIRQSRVSANRLAGIVVASPASDCAIIENEVTQNSETGLEIAGARGCQITQNQITSNGVGLKLTEAYENVIRDNFISQQREDAIALIQAQGNELRENQITKNRRGLVLQHSSGNTIAKNLLETQTETALLLLGDAEVNTVRDNVFTQNAVALELAGDTEGRAPQSNWIDQNIIRQNYLGMRMKASRGGNRFRTNEIVANQTDGLQIADATQDAFLANQISENGQWGIRLERSAQGRLEENVLIHNGEGGLHLSDVHGFYIAKNLFSDQPWGIFLEQGHDVRLVENVIRGGSRGGVHVRDAERLTLSENGIIDNTGLGLDLANARTAYLDRNIFERNAQGSALIDSSEHIDLYENDFRENGSFDLRVTDTVRDISAQRNFWGEEFEPAPPKIEGLEFAAVFPWLLRPAEPHAGRLTAGWLFETVSGGERLDASQQNSIALTLSPQVRGTRAWVIAQALSKQPEGLPSLEHVVQYFAVRASGLESGEVAVEVYYREGEVSPEEEADLKIYMLQDDHWVSLAGQLLTEKGAVVGIISTAALQQGALLALATQPSLLAAPPAAPLPPLVQQPHSEAPEPSVLEPHLQSWKFFKKTTTKGVIARLVDLITAILQLDWERAWQELLGFFIKEERIKPVPALSFEKSESHKRGGTLP